MTTPELMAAHESFRHELEESGLLVRTSVDGVYARSQAFEAVVDGIDRVVVAAGADLGARVLRFPPIFPRATYERTDYLASFPHLTGSVHSFTGDDRGAAALVTAAEEGRDWAEGLSSTEVMLVSAACHPTYPLLTGTLSEGGVTLDVYGYCFRHEPSIDPARMQSFRMHEYVRVGSPDEAEAHRDAWIERGLEVLDALGLPARQVVANDPFFGRAGRLLTAAQRAETLKVELLVDLYDGLDEGTAVVSCNCHRDHFGANFDIHTADGEVAHSACVGFGMERIALAMIRHHGLDPVRWPASITGRLWP